jgi:hypothetical protein
VVNLCITNVAIGDGIIDVYVTINRDGFVQKEVRVHVLLVDFANIS